MIKYFLLFCLTLLLPAKPLMGQISLEAIKDDVLTISTNIKQLNSNISEADTLLRKHEFINFVVKTKQIINEIGGHENSKSLKSNIRNLLHSIEDASKSITEVSVGAIITKTKWVEMKEDYIEIRDSIKTITSAFVLLRDNLGCLGTTVRDSLNGISLLHLENDQLVLPLICEALENTDSPLAQSFTEVKRFLEDHLNEYGLTVSDFAFLTSSQPKPDSLKILAQKILRNSIPDKLFVEWADVISDISMLIDKQTTINEVYSIANRKLIEKLEEDINGAEFAKKAAEEFAVPQVDVFEFKLGNAEEVYLYDIVKDKKYIWLNDSLIDYSITNRYSSISAFDYKLTDFEIKSTDPIIFSGKIGDTLRYQKINLNPIRLKFYYYVDELEDKFNKKLKPVISKEEKDCLTDRIKKYTNNQLESKKEKIHEKTKPIKELLLKMSNKDSNTAKDKEILTKMILELKNDSELQSLREDSLRIEKDNKKRISQYDALDEDFSFLEVIVIGDRLFLSPTSEVNSALSIVNLFQAKTISKDYETSRIADADFTVIKNNPVRLKAYGPSSKLNATIEAVQNLGNRDDKLNESSKQAAELKLNFEGTAFVSRFKKNCLLFRYLKAGFTLNWKGNIDELDSLKATAQDKLVDLYSGNSESIFYVTFPLFSIQSPSKEYLWDLFVIRPQLYQQKFRQNNPTSSNTTYDKLTVGSQMRFIDVQSYGSTNIRFMFGLDYFRDRFQFDSTSQLIKTKPNKKPFIYKKPFIFAEAQLFNLYNVFSKVHVRNLWGRSLKEMEVSVSLNYRINPLDAVEVIKKVILPK